jgi:hypothetical protein
MKNFFNVSPLGNAPKRNKITDPKEPKIRPSMMSEKNNNIQVNQEIKGI